MAAQRRVQGHAQDISKREHEAIEGPGGARKVLPRELQPRIRGLGLEPGITPRILLIVLNGQAWKVVDLPARMPKPPAEVGLFGKKKEALVKPTNHVERFTSGQHERSGRPVTGGFMVVPAGIQLGLSKKSSRKRDASDAQRFREGVGHRWKTPDCRKEHTVRFHLPYAGQCDVGALIKV
jgi:hypothetical protein